MKFKVGQLVLLATPHKDVNHYVPPALIIRAYKGAPKIFPHNEKENRRWIKQYSNKQTYVYDIVHCGCIEKAVLEEWLIPISSTQPGISV